MAAWAEMAAQSFEELLAGVSLAHEREVQLLRTEVQGLRKELAQALDDPSSPLAQAEGPQTEDGEPRMGHTESKICILIPGCVPSKTEPSEGEEPKRHCSEPGRAHMPLHNKVLKSKTTDGLSRKMDAAGKSREAIGRPEKLERLASFHSVNSKSAPDSDANSEDSGATVQTLQTVKQDQSPQVSVPRRASLALPVMRGKGNYMDNSLLRRHSLGGCSVGSNNSKASRKDRRTSFAETVQSAMQAFVKELECASPVVQPAGTLELSSVWSDLSQVNPDDRNTRNTGRLSVVPSSGSVLHRKSRQPSIVGLAEGARTRSIKPVLRSFVSVPSSRLRLAWDLSGVFLLLYDLIMVPLQLFAIAENDFTRWFNLAASIFWTTDILGSFFVGFHCKGLIVMDPARIAARYLKSWFLLDLSIVVMDWTFFCLNSAEYASTLGRVSRAMRAMRLLRLAKLHALLSEVNIKAKIRSELTRTMLGILKIICVIMILNHFMACGFYGLHYIMEDQPNWVSRNFAPTDGFGYRYFTSVHWSLTQFTPASMEVVPVNTPERCYAVCALLLALICFSSFVSSITSAMTRLGNSNLRQQQQTATLYRFLGQRSVPRELVNRVWHYLHDRKEMTSQARTREEDVELFALLPESLKIDLRHEMYLPILGGHPMLREYAHVEPQAVRHICKSAVKETWLSIREELFGDCVDVTHMIFVTEGLLTYNYPETEEALANGPAQGNEEPDAKWRQGKVHKGQWACEVAVWATSLSLVGPFVAASSSELLMLSVAEFVIIAQRYPGSASLLAEYGELFVDYAKAETKDCRWRAGLCNSPEETQELASRAVEAHVCANFPLDPLHEWEGSERLTHFSVGSNSSSGSMAPLFSPKNGSRNSHRSQSGGLWSIWSMVRFRSAPNTREPGSPSSPSRGAPSLGQRTSFF